MLHQTAVGLCSLLSDVWKKKKKTGWKKLRQDLDCLEARSRQPRSYLSRRRHHQTSRTYLSNSFWSRYRHAAGLSCFRPSCRVAGLSLSQRTPWSLLSSFLCCFSLSRGWVGLLLHCRCARPSARTWAGTCSVCSTVASASVETRETPTSRRTAGPNATRRAAATLPSRVADVSACPCMVIVVSRTASLLSHGGANVFRRAKRGCAPSVRYPDPAHRCTLFFGRTALCRWIRSVSNVRYHCGYTCVVHVMLLHPPPRYLACRDPLDDLTTSNQTTASTRTSSGEAPGSPWTACTSAARRTTSTTARWARASCGAMDP